MMKQWTVRMLLLLVISGAAGGCGKGGGGPAVATPSILACLLALSSAGLASVDVTGRFKTSHCWALQNQPA
jgi:hypothetical protein